MKKLGLLAAILVVVVLLLSLIQQHPPDAALVRHLAGELATWKQAHPVLAAAGYFAAYVAVAALSLPLAVWMTLAAGAVFGFWGGLVLVSFASSLGATLAFLAARYLLRDWVTAHLGDRARAIEDGFARDGAWYLFTLRLIPAVPFFAINLVMGLTTMPVLAFYLVSQIGMLAGTAVYVNAGTQLSRLSSLHGILSPALIAAFVALGLFPWAARGLLALIDRRRRARQFPRPATFDRNLIVIGAGAAGLVSAYMAASLKAKVTLIEAGAMGGDCLNTGCVPSKTLIRAARRAHQMRHADDVGLVPAEPKIDFAAVMARIENVIAEIAPHDSAERYESLGVEVLAGHARLVDPWTVETTHADGRLSRLTTRAIVLATGAAPFVPDLPGLDATGYLTSDTLWRALKTRDAPPERLVILGGGPIGTELAQAFARLGSSVTQIEQAPRLLPREDAEVSAMARAALEADGVTVLTDHRALSCGQTEGAKWIEVEGPEGARRLAFDDLVVAVGRSARLSGYGLEALGIPTTGRVIETNAHLQTRFPNILAAGDVAGPLQYTHAAANQATFAALTALFSPLKRFRPDTRVIPHATFIDPEIARVGLGEDEARARKIAFEVSRYALADLDRAIADGTRAGFVKVLTVPGKDRILGVTIVGENAAELIAEFALAMKNGLGLNRILGTVHAYPTLAEANRYVAGEWRRAHVSPFALRLLARYHAWRRA